MRRYTSVLLCCWVVAIYGRFATAKSKTKCRKIDAAFSVPENGDTYFLSGDKYIKYSFRYDSGAEEGSLTGLGFDAALRDIDAAFTDNSSNVYLLKKCIYYRYHKASEGQETALVPEGQGPLEELGLPCNVNAAINWAGHTLVFVDCEMWKLNSATSRFELEGSAADRDLPCHLNAAVNWGDSDAIFIKGAQYWKFEISMQGPFHTDDLHLCAWYLCGEADWMKEKRTGRDLKCNGDARLCDLHLNQVTLAGLHNAGSGFSSGFGFLNCWMRNHHKTITEQLQLGIRHLDIDPCYDRCGLLGTCHSFMCGGSICPILKQVRSFLRENRDDVVTINFNHEIVDPEKVFNQLNKQLQAQLGPMLNNKFRKSRDKSWPTLRASVRTNKRVFVIYAPIIENNPYKRYYGRHKWIHSENLYASTWRPFSVDDGCERVGKQLSKGRRRKL